MAGPGGRSKIGLLIRWGTVILMQCILKSPGYCSEENSLNFEINALRHLGEYQYCFNRRLDLDGMFVSITSRHRLTNIQVLGQDMHKIDETQEV
jgi:hypothetical protein